MTILPGLTSTQKDRIPAFIRDLEAGTVRQIALFPTVLDRAERFELYRDLSRVRGLRIPHVHLRSDCDETEMALLITDFATECFNIHPQASSHPFGPVPQRYRTMVYVENVPEVPDDAELEALAGICPDYSHLEAARRLGWTAYVRIVERQLQRFPMGCCHVSAIRDGEPNPWTGGEDHHSFTSLADLDYMERYADVLPARWVSLELENPLPDQLEAARYLEAIVARCTSLRSAGG